MIEFVRKTYSFVKKHLSCCNSKNTETVSSPTVMQGSKHVSGSTITFLSNNSVNCTCCSSNWAKKKKKGRGRKAPETEHCERPLLQNHEQLCYMRARPAPEPHLGGGEELIPKRTPNSESSFHSALTTFGSPPKSSPLISSNSPAHTAILRQQGDAVQGTISLGAPKRPPLGSIIQKGKPDSTSLEGKGPGDQLIVSALVPKLIPPLIVGSILWEQSSTGEFIRYIVDTDIPTLTRVEPIKVDLEALAQTQKVGESVGSLQGGAPAERATLEMEQQVSCPHKMALWVAGIFLAIAIVYTRKS